MILSGTMVTRSAMIDDEIFRRSNTIGGVIRGGVVRGQFFRRGEMRTSCRADEINGRQL